jgi:ELWxxDGT repeat protein
MKKVFLLLLTFASLSGFAQYPKGMTDITSALAAGDAGFALTTEDDRSGTFKSTLVIIGDNMFFTAKSTANGDELYVSDGTLEGTKLVMDINPGSGDASPRYLVSLNGKLYFQADNGTNGVELWESDGTEAGTKMVADIYTGAESSAPDMLTVLDGKILFRATTVASAADGKKWLHIFDPETQVASLVSEIQARAEGDAIIPRIQVDNKHKVAYFIGEPVGENQEVYKTDGTPAGTGKIMDVTPEALGSSNIQWIYVHDDSVVVWRQKTPRKYAGADSVNYVQHLSEQIWISGGTAATTRLLSHFDKNVDIDGNGVNTQFAFPVSWNGKLYFRADNGVNGVELCVSDLTTEGTVQVQDLNPGTNASWPEDFAIYKGHLCFDADAGAGNEGAEIRYLDDADNTIKLMAYAWPGDDGSWSKRTTAFKYNGVDSLLYFVGSGPSTGGPELFVASKIGSQAELVYALDPAGSTPHNLKSWKNALYFTSNKVTRLFRYQFTVAPKIIAEGKIFYDYSNFQDTIKVKVAIANPGSLTNKVMKIEPNDDSELFKIGKTKAGAFGFDPVYTSNTGIDSFYVVANHTKMNPDGFKFASTLRIVHLEIDTLVVGERAVLEPVFRNELIYHIDLGNTTDSIDNSVDTLGSYQSVFDQMYGTDAVTGKSWGYLTDGWGILASGNKWSTMHEANYQANPEGQIYDLEVEPGDYVVQIGWYENWGSRTQNVSVNGVEMIAEIVSLPGDYLVEQFEVTVAENKLSLAWASLNANNAYFSWFKVGKKCTGDNCATQCFDPMCRLRSELYNPEVPTGTRDLSKKAAPVLYPNPATNAVSIALDIKLFNSVQVVDLAGNTVLHINADKNITPLDVSHLQNGVYLVRAIGKGGIHTQKLVISR